MEGMRILTLRLEEQVGDKIYEIQQQITSTFLDGSYLAPEKILASIYRKMGYQLDKVLPDAEENVDV